MKAKLLLVDDEPRARRLLEVSLRRAGFEVCGAGNGVEAIECLERFAPTVVVCDTAMPEMDGFGLLAALRDDPARPRIPFIFLVREGNLEDRLRAVELGADDFIPRPPRAQEVIARVRLLLARGAYRRLERAPQGAAQDGRLDELGVADVVTALHAGRRSGILRLLRPGQEAVVWLESGRVVDAICGAASGERAFHRLLLWTHGAYAFSPAPAPAVRRIEIGTAALLQEGLRRIDEWERLRADLPRLDTICELDYRRLADKLQGIPDEVNALLRLFDGYRTLLRVVEDGPFEDLTALDIIARLYAEGVIREAASPRGERGRPEPGVEAWLAGADAHALRVAGHGSADAPAGASLEQPRPRPPPVPQPAVEPGVPAERSPDESTAKPSLEGGDPTDAASSRSSGAHGPELARGEPDGRASDPGVAHSAAAALARAVAKARAAAVTTVVQEPDAQPVEPETAAPSAGPETAAPTAAPSTGPETAAPSAGPETAAPSAGPETAAPSAGPGEAAAPVAGPETAASVVGAGGEVAPPVAPSAAEPAPPTMKTVAQQAAPPAGSGAAATAGAAAATPPPVAPSAAQPTQPAGAGAAAAVAPAGAPTVVEPGGAAVPSAPEPAPTLIDLQRPGPPAPVSSSSPAMAPSGGRGPAVRDPHPPRGGRGTPDATHEEEWFSRPHDAGAEPGVRHVSVADETAEQPRHRRLRWSHWVGILLLAGIVALVVYLLARQPPSVVSGGLAPTAKALSSRGVPPGEAAAPPRRTAAAPQPSSLAGATAHGLPTGTVAGTSGPEPARDVVPAAAPDDAVPAAAPDDAVPAAAPDDAVPAAAPRAPAAAAAPVRRLPAAPRSAAPVHRKPRRSGPPSVAALLRRGRRLLRRKRYRAALASFRAAARRDPRNARAHYGVGLALYDAGHELAAAPSFERAVRLQPGLAAVYVRLGSVYQAQGRIARARWAYRMYLKKAPNGRHAADVRSVLKGL